MTLRADEERCFYFLRGKNFFKFKVIAYIVKVYFSFDWMLHISTVKWLYHAECPLLV